MEIILYISLGVITIILFIILVIGISLSLGLRNQTNAYYDPEIKEWIPLIELTEEQLSRRIPGKRKLAKKK